MDEDFCEIDFTTTTVWEIFNARLEEIFYSWHLCRSSTEFSTESCVRFPEKYGTWCFKSENIEYDGKEFEIFFCRKILDQLSQSEFNDKEPEYSYNLEKFYDLDFENDIPLDSNCSFKNNTNLNFREKIFKLISLYKLQDFVLLVPARGNSSKLSESFIKIVMSSFCISAYNTRCYVPMFIQIFESWQNSFIGICIDDVGLRTDYQMMHLGKIPPKFQYFSGLLDLFKSKVTSAVLTNYVWTSVKYSYAILNFKHFSYPPTKQTKFGELQIGASCEPIAELRLHVSWPKVAGNMIVDNENHSGFDPLLAQNWSLQMQWKKTKHLLGQNLLQFIHICESSKLMNELISDLLNQKSFTTSDLPVPSSISVSKIISGVNNIPNDTSNSNESKRQKRFLPENTLINILYYLFPDADANNTYPYKLSISEEDEENVLLKGMKTCSIQELPWRLSFIMCIIINSYGEHAAAQFWFEFVQELRFRWEKCLKILGVQKGIPNHKSSLLNQKLQMLNCCIEKRIKRENIKISEDSDGENHEESVKYDSEDEEFFDCQTESNIKEETNTKIGHCLWNQPEGRLRKFNNLRLIETGEYMYIPMTQEMTPKTEDQLEDDAILLMKLGSDSKGSKLRARMMCESLYSDMESFKAANPGAILDDFIRWYSPRDWIETSELDKFGQRKGKLSNRMLLPGNMWKEVWDSSLPVPASRQKYLFDDNREAEKVLEFFQTRKCVADVFSLLLPTLMHATLHIILNDENLNNLRHSFPFLNDQIITLIQKAINATRNNVDINAYKTVAEDISNLENITIKYKSLEYKLFPDKSSRTAEEKEMLIKFVLKETEFIISNGPNSKLGQRIMFLFANELKEISLSGNGNEKNKNNTSSANKATNNSMRSNESIDLPENPCNSISSLFPYQKEFTLHVSSALPYVSSRSSDHTLTAHICSDEVFIASSITQDSIFI